MSIRESQSQHSSILSKASQDPVQVHQTSVVMKPVATVCVSSIAPEFLYLVSCSFVSFVLLHYLTYYLEPDAFFFFPIILVLIYLVNVLLSDSVVEAGSSLMSRSLGVKQYNASKVYFAYTFAFGFSVSLAVPLGLLLGLKKEIIYFMLWWELDEQWDTFYTWLVVLFALFYFALVSRKLLHAEGLFGLELAHGFSFLAAQFYVLTAAVLFAQMLGREVDLFTFIPAFAVPLVSGAVVQFCGAFHARAKKVAYQNTHFLQRALFRPFRPRVLLDVFSNTCYFVLLNSGEAFQYALTYSAIVQDSEYQIVTFSILLVELSNCLNKAIAATLGPAFRINLQLKRYDRVFQLFASAFGLFFANLGFQIIAFAVRNKLYRAVFNGDFEDSVQFYHCSLDGLLGTFNAYTMAVVRSDSSKKVGLLLGSIKMALSGCFWYVGYQLNTSSCHFSSMIFYYRYCGDILGFGFYTLYFIKFLKLRKFNVSDEPVHVEVKPPKLVLQEMQPIDPISRNSTDSKSKDQSKEATSKEYTKSSKLDLFQSQSWTGDEGKDSKGLIRKEDDKSQ
ncbi:MatE_and transmembrane domain-containing protein [Hexamita inflata]|uniref:MatE and transmembrane domain-containing protein n=1 Tax=Hexamita inflata TaxID=28002 RepID=A0AA86QXB6_9EUKA|nr:MatE and transmembrane domain-containing protein [Hexamita inflata]